MRIFQLIFSPLLSLVPKIRSQIYLHGILKRHRLEGPVISVGNLTVGGTGKTPFVIYLSEWSQKLGKQPIILSRGYKGAAEKTNLLVSDGKKVYCSPAECGDEPFLLANRLKQAIVIVGKNRAASSELADLSRVVDPIFILDDGFQHLQLERDIDLVLLDGTDPFGKGGLFPFGRLREPFSAIARADAAIISRSHQMGMDSEIIRKQVRQLNPECGFFSFHHSLQTLIAAIHPRQKSTKAFCNQPLAVVAALGNARQFLRDLQIAGLEIRKRYFFRDHHSYTQNEVDMIYSDCLKSQIKAIITTEKDLVKLERLDLPKDFFWAARLELREDPPKQFDQWLQETFSELVRH